MIRLLPAASLILLSSSAAAGIVHVDASATGAGDGSSWTDAYTSLRVALDTAVLGDDLWVAQGTYTPGPSAAESDSFFLKSGVRLYGGFAGGETSLGQRDWDANVTYLSGDVGQDDDVSGWPSGWNIHSSNSAHVLTAVGVDSTATVDGFFIGHGHTGPAGTPAGSTEMAGSGLYNVGSSPTIANCTFEYNVSAWAWGAAIYNYDSSPSITHCTFRYNAVHLSSGAGIGNIGNSAPTIRACDFYSNQATTGSGGQEAQGCAIANYWDVPPITIEDCSFTSNVAKQFYSSGSGIEQARGGAISSFNDGLTVKGCVFRYNTANAGGAIYVWGSATVVNSLFEKNRVYNMVTGGITQSGYASALGGFSFAGEEVVVAGCTVFENEVVGGESGAVVGGGALLMSVSNSILWGNEAPPPASPRQKHYKGNVDLAYTCIENLYVPHAGDEVPPPAEIPGCIDQDPLFVDELGGDLHLASGSPCIDTGSNAHVPGLANTDLDGLDRVAQGATSFTVDMGPYEHGSTAPGACPTIVSDPQALVVVAGEAARFDVLAQGQALTFQWRKDGAPLGDGGAISGSNSPSLLLATTTIADAGNYDVLVSNACTQLTSGPASLTVDAAPLGTVVCSADGTDPGCPCGNDKDEGEGCENSQGDGARLTGSGTASVSAGDALLSTDQLPPNVWAIYFVGSNLLNGGIGSWFGDGLLCTTPIKRFDAANSGASGTLQLADPASLAPAQISAGDTRTFQVWYRDPAGPCGSGWNTSNAYRIQFTE